MVYVYFKCVPVRLLKKVYIGDIEGCSVASAEPLRLPGRCFSCRETICRRSEEALYLLATCYYRSGKPYKAYRLLKAHSSSTPQVRFLLAKCCVELSKLAEAEQVLIGGVLNKQKSQDDLITEFGDSASFTLSLLGHIYCKTDRATRGAECFRRSLMLNPFLWSPFQNLCLLGDKVDADQVFRFSSLQHCSVASPPPSVSPAQNSSHRMDTAFMETPQHTLELNRLNLESSNGKQTSDLSLSYIDSTLISPETGSLLGNPVSLASAGSLLAKQNKPKSGRSLLGGPNSLSPLTPSFGILPLEPSPGDPTYLQNYSSSMETQSTASSKKTVSRMNQSKTVFSQSGNSRDVLPMPFNPSQTSAPHTSGSPQVLSPSMSAPPNIQPRRSSRLFTSASSTAKENSKKLKMKFPTKIPNRKTKCKSTKTSNNSNLNESLDILRLDPVGLSLADAKVPQHQRAAADNVLALLRELGRGYQALCSYNCREAIAILTSLPPQHYNTGWVLTHIGRAYFELAEYTQAERLFSEVRRMESYRVEGMEIYSTTLWHLQKDVALSALSKDLTDMDKNCPEAWCVAGNCFSLQREHDIAIKFFQRAIQVDPGFAYAYTLLGHEFVMTEELERALACFRNAIRVSSRHYNAWYGLGMIYFKQEKFNLAEIHFRKALSINPQSSVLLCHVGVVQHALKKSDAALETLNKAIGIDPKNPLCKFHRASILFANDKYKAALQELEELKQIVPKESLVYFLIGKVYKKLGQTHLALMNFSWAMDLDPKGANNQIKEAIDKRYLPEDEAVAEPDDSQDSSVMTDADDSLLHTAESDVL
ncbi:cell division cycle protein 27 homolog isoform X2 [Syngnathoides biaculeatus]|uniref:cell division cycle protein 27 homolog isoform X2 n=1 Tax=Syngnathoides biaculeatus TaxID=300417 RepID=UPI002ADDED81|nr:cell division cycle protein 27 homolog isoform X2 [Syngnathoides biaculeatus]